MSAVLPPINWDPSAGEDGFKANWMRANSLCATAAGTLRYKGEIITHAQVIEFQAQYDAAWSAYEESEEYRKIRDQRAAHRHRVELLKEEAKREEIKTIRARMAAEKLAEEAVRQQAHVPRKKRQPVKRTPPIPSFAVFVGSVPDDVAAAQARWERSRTAARMVATGMTLAAAGARMALSRERVRQLVARFERRPVSPLQQYLDAPPVLTPSERKTALEVLPYILGQHVRRDWLRP